MLINYIEAAMHKAHYEFLKNDKVFYGEIEATRGVWATGETLEACRDELREVLEEWIILSLKLNHPIPEIDGISFEPAQLENA